MIYEYKCKKCEKIIEKSFKIGEAPKKIQCCDCKSSCERVFSPPMIQFRGPGFYVNDNKATTNN